MFLGLAALAFGLVTAIGGATAQPTQGQGRHAELRCFRRYRLDHRLAEGRCSCLFTPNLPGPPEAYVGTISKLGLDIGATTGGPDGVGGLCADRRAVSARWPATMPARRRSDDRGRPRRQRAGRRLQPHGRAATVVGARARSASTSRRASPHLSCGRRAERTFHDGDSTAACGRPFRLCPPARPCHVRPPPETIPRQGRELGPTPGPVKGGDYGTKRHAVPGVPGASRWWARSRAARPRCSKRSSRAPARSSARARSRPAPPSATPARKRAITR